MNKKLSDLGEFGLIDSIKKQIQYPKSIIKGVGDDTAVVPLSKTKYQLLTTDMLVEDVHFQTDMPAKDIGYKTVACSISDIAAMGGIPKYILISFAAPKNTDSKFVLDVFKGMKKAADEFGANIVGGDTVKSDKVVINVAVMGEVLKNEVVLRSGAKPGDRIFITGPLGGSLKSSRHLNFSPRIKESQYLVKNFKPTSMMDISDGLASDLKHILDESNVGAYIGEALIPLNKNCKIDNALFDGEDFELLFTLNKKDSNKMIKIKNKPFKFYLIGEIVAKKGLVFIDIHGVEKNIKQDGFDHFVN